MPSHIANRYGLTAGLRSNQGFVIIMVIVVLILMLLLCTSYLRVIRLRAIPVRDEFASPDAAMTSVIDLILQTVGKDKPLPTADPTTIQEPYDYPWTDQSRSSAWASLSYPTLLSAQAAAGDPLYDDAWLADAMPDPTSQRWTHLTNLRGSFLNYNDSDLANTPLNAFTGKRIPADTLSNGTECPAGGIALDDSRLVDADGDGIGDSLWFYPPISRIGNTRFVAAVYIEDLSAKINLNTAFPQRDSSGSYGSLGNQPLGLSPCDVDAYALCAGLGCSSADLQNVVQFRTGSATFPLPAAWDVTDMQHVRKPLGATRPLVGGPINPTDTRWNLWQFNASRTDSSGTPVSPDTRVGLWPSAKKYNVDSEVELRYRGGLNNANVLSDIEDTSLGMGNSLRQSDSEPSAAYTGNPWGLAPGKPKIASSNATASLMNYFMKNPRRWTTVTSGDCSIGTGFPAQIAALYNDSDSVCRPWNPNNLAQGGWTDNHGVEDHITWLVKHSFRGTQYTAGDPATAADDVNVSPGFAELFKNSETDLNKTSEYAACQFVANLTDYLDEDNYVTRAFGMYGMEALPFIREVYGQRQYNWAAGTYTATASDSAWAVEIVNPFNRPVKLTNVWLRMENSDDAWNGNSGYASLVVGELSQLAAAGYYVSGGALPTLTDSNGTTHLALPAGHRLVIVREDAGVASSLANTIVTTGTNVHVYRIPNASANTRWPSGFAKDSPGAAYLNQGDATFDLCATRDPKGNDPGTSMYRVFDAMVGTCTAQVWKGAYSSARVPYLPKSYASATGSSGWRKVDSRCRSDLNVMQYRPTDFIITGTEPSGTTYLNGGALVEELGDAGLTANLPIGAVDWSADTEQMYLNLNAMAGRLPDHGAIDHAAEILDIPLIGPRLYESTERRKWGGGNMANDPGSSSLVIHENTYADALRVALTTDGTTLWPNPGKPSRTGHLDALTLRTDDQTDIHFVDMTASASPNNRVPHAIQLLRWLSPLNKWDDWVDQNSTTFTSTGIDANNDKWLSWGEDDESESFLPGRINLNTMPYHLLRQTLPFPTADRDEYAQLIVARRQNPVGAIGALPAKNIRSASAKGLAYPGELQVDSTKLSNPALARWLEEFASTRSDVFAAHIIVQGYAADDFSSGPVASKRIMVLVERASVNTPGGKATVLASFTY